MARPLNHAKRDGYSASAASRRAEALERQVGLSAQIAPSPNTIAHYQAQLAEVEAHPDFTAPAFLPTFRERLAAGVALQFHARKIHGWRVVLGLAAPCSPERVAAAKRAERRHKGQLARHGVDRGTFKAGLARLDAVQAARPLKPPTRKIEE